MIIFIVVIIIIIMMARRPRFADERLVDGDVFRMSSYVSSGNG